MLYGYKVAGNGGWETPYRWDKSKVRLCNTGCRMLQHACGCMSQLSAADVTTTAVLAASSSSCALPCTCALITTHQSVQCTAPWYLWPLSQILLDPYAKLVKGRAVFGKRDTFEQFKTKARGMACRELQDARPDVLPGIARPRFCALLTWQPQQKHQTQALACIFSLPAGGQRVPRHL